MIVRDDWSALKKLIYLRGSGAVGGSAYDTVTGNPVSFSALSAPLRQLKVAFSPVQNLNGYDSPWPAGGGKNKFFPPDAPITIDGITVEGTSDGEIWVHGTPTFASGYKTFNFGTLPESLEGETVSLSISEKIVGFGIVIGSNNGNLNFTMADTVTSRSGVYTAGGTRSCYVNIRYDIGTVDKKFKIQLEVNATPTAWTPYSNECPISGWSSLTVEQRGKNLWNDDFTPQTIEAYSVVGAKTTAYGKELHLPAGTYTFSFNGTTTSYLYGNVLNADGTWKSTYRLTTPNPEVCTITLANGEYANLYLASGQSAELTSGKIQLELGNEATAYAPYTPSSRSISISLGETVYSGYVDVISGVGEVTCGITDAADLPWSYDGVRWQSKMSGIEVFPTRSANILFEKYGTSTSASAQTENMGFTVGGAVYIYTTDSVNSPTGKICYPLATPITIQLTPQEVNSLAGDNTMWTDADSLTVEYRSN